ncbi:hypothetical protein [Legionella brunensis]|uniref:Glycosyltransferase RgtA/B/C/D-like domain-containing protein n=1 Tax=Legionella brunensis TaxID=29422 RepID=A0A0W0SLE8_9GAMM|nr:hypothetical protein [Legionella brunensis]KTC84208.1 hypothetical protein Lbru_1569 [Legionella brunensis]
MLLLICLLFCCVIIGWAFAFSKLLRSNFSEGLFSTISFLGLVMFCSFLLALPKFIALILLATGSIFFLFFIYSSLNKPLLLKQDIITICFFLGLSIVNLAIVYGLKYRSIDDYSFWGTISKYLFLFNQLPTNGDYIHPVYLSYIPGAASFHYLLYTLAGGYSQTLGYFAQGLILISAFMILFDPKYLSRSVCYLSLCFILFTLAYGTVFARMEVDAYVAAYLFAITWLIYKKGDSPQLIFAPIIFLSLIKEIGLLFSIAAIVLLLALEKSNRKAIIYGFLATAAVLAIKLLWKIHVTSLGFYSFAQAVNLKSAAAAFNPFNTYYHPVQVLFLKAVFFASFDYLIKTPYLVMYGLIVGLWYWLLKKSPINRARMNKLMIIFALFIIAYLIMLYFLQAIVFDIGHTNPQILSFHRYYNMLFLPWACIIVFMALDSLKPQAFESLLSRTSLTTVSLALVILIVGKIERGKKFYDHNQLYKIYALLNKSTAQLSHNNWSVCLLNPPKPEYEVTMPLTYFFMPHRIFYPATKEQLASCDLSLEWADDSEISLRVHHSKELV